MKIFYSDARCGAGKTFWACEMMARRVGRYVLAVDRKVAGQEREGTIRSMCSQFGTDPTIIQIFSVDGSTGPRGSDVARQIAEALDDHRMVEHIILIITHAGMKLTDFGDRTGWTMVVDEVPQVIEHMNHSTGAMLSFLEANYALHPDGSGSKIKFKGSVTRGDMAQSGSRHWLPFHMLALSGEARCDLHDWREAATWSAWRVWPVSRLATFDEVYLLGDSVLDTETALFLARDGVQFEEITEIKERDKDRMWRSRPITIRYFAEDHTAASGLFDRDGFDKELAKVGKWIAANTPDAASHLWTCNDRYAPIFKRCGILGEKVQPLQAGTNGYAAMVVASMIYTAKASPQEAALYEREWQITANQITRGRERYGLKQFFLRTAMRVPDDTSSLEFRVYDRDQAEDLKSYLETKYDMAPVLVFQDVGIVCPETVRAFQQASLKPPKTDEERKADQRRWAAESRERKRKMKVAA